MKKTVILILFLSFFNICFSQISNDKYYHCTAGVIISGGTYMSSRLFAREMNPIAPSLVTIACASAKEGFDAFNGGQFSYSDWSCTVISGVVTNIVMKILIKQKRKQKEVYDPFELKNIPLTKR